MPTPPMRNQNIWESNLRQADERHVPYVVILGLEPNTWLLKNMTTTNQTSFSTRSQLVTALGETMAVSR